MEARLRMGVLQKARNSVEECVKIEIEDIQHEIDYWTSSLYAYVLGANPPTSVMEGFIRRVWKEHGVDKVINVKKGLFLIHFKTMDQCNKAKEGEKIFFDSKPVLIKAWSPETDMDLENIMTIPIWVHVHAHYKYWSHKSLEKLTKGIGRFVKVDHTTANRDRLAFARCMVEVKMDQDFPHQVCFLDEHNQKKSIPITYEWRPVKCNSCQLIGHDGGQCYKKKVTSTKAVWQRKTVQQENKEAAPKGDTRKEEWLAQTALHQYPENVELARIEKEAAEDYNKKNKCFSQFLRQKAKIKWIQEGDANTRLFHKSLKAQRLKSNIHAIQNLDGNSYNSPGQIASAFSQFYKQLIGSSEMVDRIHVEQHIVDEGPTLRNDQKEEIMRSFNAQDVKEAIFSIDGDKAPGPDGFGASFFKENWNIVGPLVSDAVLDFFKNGRILKEINNTFISLIPKVQCPKNVSEFRPISCCNVIYKCITKLICSRLKLVLPDLIAENQGAFVHGRYIIHNIMVCQDMVRGYGRKNTAPGCIIKLDIKKAYDTINWEFLEEMLSALGFPDTFTRWIMTCVRSAQYSLVINGIPNGHEKFKRGLRQGDPISPLLFVICMEYLSRILRKMTKNSEFKFHPKCKPMNLTHLCFADDLILCSKGEIESVKMLINCFHAFSLTSGLQASKDKTEIYTCGMKEEQIQEIIHDTGFRRGHLPFKYLGIPISSKRISIGQCENLIEKMTSRIRIWSSKNMSYAGRAQLINAVLLSIHQYWAQVFILPKAVLTKIEGICRAFLWSGKWYSNAPGNISWDRTCTPKSAGGLGIKDIQRWNYASLGRYVWALATKQDNLWVKWVHAIYIKDSTWEDYYPKANVSWYWKKIWECKQKLIDKGVTMNELQNWHKFSVKKVYMALSEENSKVFWHRNVWGRLAIPKHKFCAWLAVQERLKTKDRLEKIGVVSDTGCVLCQEASETWSHLFFQCKYSKQLIQEISQWLGARPTATNIPRMYRWINRRATASKFQKEVWNAAINASIYHIWQQRNKKIWKDQGLEWDQVVKQIKALIIMRINGCIDKKKNGSDKQWINKLYSQ
ncbi:LINE-1 retrotransposable element ORF2 protein [Bienertia sinuspersici]